MSSERRHAIRYATVMLIAVGLAGCDTAEPLEHWHSHEPSLKVLHQCAAEFSSNKLEEVVKARNVDVLRNACKHDVAWACYWLGDTLSASTGQEEMLAQACKLGLPVGCARLYQLTGNEEHLKRAASDWFRCCCPDTDCADGELEYCLDRGEFIVQMGGTEYLLKHTRAATNNMAASADSRQVARHLLYELQRHATRPLRITAATVLLVAGCAAMAGWVRWRRRSATREDRSPTSPDIGAP